MTVSKHDWSYDANGVFIKQSRRQRAVIKILRKQNISKWARKYWSGVLKKI